MCFKMAVKIRIVHANISVCVSARTGFESKSHTHQFEQETSQRVDGTFIYESTTSMMHKRSNVYFFFLLDKVNN